MAENESLDLRQTPRWQRVYRAVERGGNAEQVADLACVSLYRTVQAVMKRIPFAKLSDAACGNPEALPDRPTITLGAGRHFRLYPLGLKGDVSAGIPARLVDLIRLGTAMHVVDGLFRRSGSTAGYRCPYLEVEVLDPAFWKEPWVAAT